MAINTFLQGLGATHLFTLNNVGTSTSDDLGGSSTPTSITSGTYSFQASPTCIGVTHSVRTEASTDTGIDGATFDGRSDINDGSVPYRTSKRSILLWLRQEEIQNPSCIYEQGGSTNNFAIMGGAQLTFQAADAGQPFLICAAKNLAVANRNYLAVCGWEYHTQHAGSGNRVYLILNGVYQSGSELSGTAPFPSHAGDITLGNSGENLRSFSSTNLESQTTAKNTNYLSFYNNVSLTVAESREVFERMVIPEVLIAADTVANQQTALDALSGNTYQDVNCAIEIRQATDATNYTLTLNNITFVENANLKDIAVQYVGSNTITIINAGSNAIETSTPTEKDLDGGTTIITGGGTINIVNTYSLAVTGLTAGSRLRIYNETTSAQVYNAVVSGTSYTASYVEGTGYSANDVLNLRVTKIDKLEAVSSVVVSATGWTALMSQDANAIYNAHGVDGATVTGISWDSGNMQFDFNDSDNNIEGADIGAWYYYFITTEIGIAEAFGALVWSQINKITNAASKVAITFDNIKASPLQINNCWIDRDDGVSIIATTSNSIQINPPAVFNTSIDDIALIKAKTDLLNFNGADVKATLDGEEVVTDTASRDASKADVSAIETKTEADSRQVILISEHDQTQTDISNLNDFDPANDDVAKVNLVDVTTTNSDMRGTDNANTVVPDNSGITQIQTDISSLNDVSASDVYTEFTTGTNENAFKADVSGLSTFDASSDDVNTNTASRNASKADVSNLSTFDPGSDDVTTDSASREASKADTTDLATKDNQEVINDGVKKASLLIPHSDNLPDQ